MWLANDNMMSYLVMMAPRLVELRRVIKADGSIYLHCDSTASHYLKLLMDAVFGPPGFQNEIIWQRTAVKGDARRKFGSVHDVLLLYSKTEDYFFNSVYRLQDDEYRGRFRLDDHDGRGLYRIAPLDSPNPRPNLTYEYKGYQPPAKGWRVSLDLMQKLDAEGRLAFPKSDTGRIGRKHYLSEQKGAKVTDVWVDIPPLQAASAEKLHYPTQKPLALLERIVLASSSEGDVVLDPFCGCGTTVDAAQALGRRWIGIDIAYLAIDVIKTRLEHRYGEATCAEFYTDGIPEDVEGAKALFTRNAFDFETWAVSLVKGQPNEKQVGDKGVDGRISFDAGLDRAGIAVVSVKGGKQVNPSMVQALVGAMKQADAQMGVFVCMTKPTPGMKEVAAQSGTYKHLPSGNQYPRIQLITIGELLSGTRPKMPTVILPYIKTTPRPHLSAVKTPKADTETPASAPKQPAATPHRRAGAKAAG